MRLGYYIARAARVAPTRTATRFGDRSRSWAEFADRVARLAGGMAALGVRPGDRVAYLGQNSDRYLEWFFGAAWAGAVFVPVNTRLAPPEIEQCLSDSGAAVLFADDDVGPYVPGHVRALVHVGEDEPPAGWIAYEDVVAAPTAAQAHATGRHLAGLFYTGGTTGRAKGVMLSHDNLVANALHMIPGAGWGPTSTYLHAAPMFHIANAAGMIGTAVCGGTSAIVDRFTPGGVARAIAEHGVTHTILVPTMIAMLVEHLERDPAKLGTLRGITYGGSAISESVIERTTRALPGVELCQCYGQTEAGPTVTMLPPERHVLDGPLAGKARSAGQAAPGVEVAILAEDGSELPRGEVGEICARGDNVMLGYWDRPELTGETLRDGWLHTGDGGWMDEDGFVFVADRLKDMIVSGGENVYSAEVENAIHRHPAVAECAVIGVPSERWGEEVHAVVVARDGAALEPDELIAHCRGLIAGYKCPRTVEIRSEPLPKSGAGKVLKSALREPAPLR